MTWLTAQLVRLGCFAAGGYRALKVLSRGDYAERLELLKKERIEAAEEVPANVLADYERLYEHREEDTMAPMEIADVKRHEYHCGACMMAVPMQSGVALLTGQFTNCPNCQCILYLAPESAEAITPTGKR